MGCPGLSNLGNCNSYLSRYPNTKQPAAFEYLVAYSLSRIYNLPFQSKDNEDNTINYRLIWNGKVSNMSRAIHGPDAICYAYGNYLVIEATIRYGANQWRKEFVEALNHYDEFIQYNNLKREHVYLVLTARTLHEDTYKGFSQKAKEGHNCIILESANIGKIGKTTKMVPTIRHLDLCFLLTEMKEKLGTSISLVEFRKEISKCISKWQKEVLGREKNIFWGLRAFKAMVKAGGNTVGISDILLNIERDSNYKQYVKLFSIDPNDINLIEKLVIQGLDSEGLALKIPSPREILFSRVSKIDFKERTLRMINEVEKT